MYRVGDVVPQNNILAHMWLNLAAARTPDHALRDAAIKFREQAEAKMTPAQVAEAQRMAREWVPRRNRSAGHSLTIGPRRPAAE